MSGKLIVIEGTDCSGKETQTTKLVERLKKEGYKVAQMSYPMYDSPTGKIVGACLLGKPAMCEELLKTNHGFFKEGGGNVDPLTAISYYAADRRYHLPLMQKYLSEGYILIVDRYVTSNMAHRGGFIEDFQERQKMYAKIDTLEYEIMELPRPNQVILLYMPYEYACILKKNRLELPDEAEANEKYLHLGEKAYLELAKLYNYDIINCVENNTLKTIDAIHEEVYKLILKK